MSNGITVSVLEDAGMRDWDGFVEACPEATFFHRAGWRSVLAGMGHRPHYLLARNGNGVIEGILPLGELRSLFFGHALISVPFCVYGGVAAGSETARKALLDEARQLADRLGVDYLELRNPASPGEGWHAKELYVNFSKEIDPDPDANMLAIPRKQRAMVRKAIKNGLESEIDEGIDRFYDAYASSVRNLGTPILAKKYFQLVRDTFGDACEILTVTSEGKPVSSVMSYYFRDQVLPFYGGGGVEARALKSNDFMYWELMRRSCERGVRIFDYGRSKPGTGSYSFKKNWGFEPEPLTYYYYLVKADQVPDINPLNPKYRLFISMWKKLPLSVSTKIGPYLAKYLG